MTKGIRNMLVGSIGVAGIVGVLAIMDMVFELFAERPSFPFRGNITMDVMFLISAGIVAYMGYETYQEFK